MDLAFEDEQLRDVCVKRGRALSVHGPDIAHELHKRLADIRAAETALDLIVGTRVIVDGGGEAMHVALANEFELRLVANHVQNPITASGRIDWGKVARVKILAISRMAIA